MIQLVPITAANWKECISLKVTDEQRNFVPDNLYSIAEAQFYSQACSLAIYSKAGQMVGYALYGREVQSGKWKIFRLMIDASQQGKGYGRAAMQHLIAEIRQQPDADAILIAYQNENHTARQLYTSLGFVEQAEIAGVITAQLQTPG